MYGIGGTIGPLVATALVSRGLHWSRFYFTTLGLASVALAFSGWAFRGYEEEESLHQDHHAASTRSESRWSKLRSVITDKATCFGSLFIFAYQGTEVAISGWVISFLVSYRGGDINKIGYVTAGFWAGITLGEHYVHYYKPTTDIS